MSGGVAAERLKRAPSSSHCSCGCLTFHNTVLLLVGVEGAHRCPRQFVCGRPQIARSGAHGRLHSVTTWVDALPWVVNFESWETRSHLRSIDIPSLVGLRTVATLHRISCSRRCARWMQLGVLHKCRRERANFACLLRPLVFFFCPVPLLFLERSSLKEGLPGRVPGRQRRRPSEAFGVSWRCSSCRDMVRLPCVCLACTRRDPFGELSSQCRSVL